MDRERRDQIEIGMYNMGDSWVHKALRDCLDHIEAQERRIEELEAQVGQARAVFGAIKRGAQNLQTVLRTVATEAERVAKELERG